MKTIQCTWLGLEANSIRVYWIVGKDYPVVKETATQYKIKDEFDCLRTVSKKTRALTGFTSDIYATAFEA